MPCSRLFARTFARLDRRLPTEEINMTTPLWAPLPEEAQRSNMARLISHVDAIGSEGISTAQDLHRFSIENAEQFWPALWDFCGLVGDKGNPPFIENPDKMPGARFFPGARLNYAENLLTGAGEGPALIFRCEDGTRREISRGDLRIQVSKAQKAMKAMGVAKGDRVAAMMPNMAGNN